MGHDLTIYDRNGERKFNLLSRAAVSGVSRASQKTSLLADDTITITAESAKPLDITIGDNIRIFGKRYTFNQLPQPTKSGERVYSYELTLEGLQYDLIDVHYHLPADAYGETYYANLQRHLEILEWNINRIHPGWTVQVDADAYDPDSYQNITTTEKNALAMLQDLCSLFNVEFEITAQANAGKVHVKKKAGTTHQFTLRYGRGKGLYKLSRTNVNNAGITNRLYVYGGQDNLPQNYGHTKLCLANTTRLTSYLEDTDSIAAYGVKEGEKNYPDIKAERVGVITAVGEDRITFFDTSGDPDDPENLPMFDLNEKTADGSTKYLIDGTAAKIKFQTGNLAGYEFELHSYDHGAKKFIINRFTDENGLVIPNDTQDAFTFAVGNKYIITDINLPDSYVLQAQGKLEAAARTDFAPMTQPQVSYKLGLTEGFFTSMFGKEVETELLHVGDYIHIIDEEIGVDKEIRITAITRDLLRLHSYELTLSDTVVKSSIVKVINDIQDIQDVISFNSGFTDPGKARRRWMATQELLNLVFDPEGDYYSEKIKPLSIETQMLSVGAKSTQFTLQNVTIQPNYNGDTNAINFSTGRLVHYGIDPENTRPWVMSAATLSGLITTQPYYIYAVCPRQGGNGSWLLSTTPHKCEEAASVYYFLIGVLNSVSTDTHGGNAARLISLTYGSSTINGRFIRCGRIESSGGGATYFDLDTGEIRGNIRFTDGSSIEDVINAYDATIIEGGKIKTDLIDVGSLTAKKVEVVDNDGAGVKILPNDNGVGSVSIYNAQGREVAVLEGGQYNALSDLFSDTIADVAVNSYKTGQASVYASSDTSDGRANHTRALSSTWHTSTPCEVFLTAGKLYCYAKAAGYTKPSTTTGITKISSASVSISISVQTYSDAECTHLVRTDTIATCSASASAGTASSGAGSYIPGDEDSGSLVCTGRSVKVPAGYHKLYLNYTMFAGRQASQASVQWGSAATGGADIASEYRCNYYVSRFFANGFCLGRRGDNYVMTWYDGENMNFAVETNGVGFKVLPTGITYRTSSTSQWKTLT